MAIYDLTVSLDLKQNLNIYATCKQLDNLNLICSIYDNSAQVDLTNYSVRLKAMKADLIPLVQEYTGISITSNIATISADEQLTTTAGETPIELQFIDKTSGKKKATFNLILQVMSSTLAIDRNISMATYTLLEELENKLDQTSDFFENISEAVEINNELKTSISGGTILKTGLDTDITTGNALKTGLENSTATANSAKTALDNSVVTANTTKNAVDASNTNAQATKTALEADIVQAQSNSFASEVTNARGAFGNLKARLDASDSSLSEKANYNYFINGNFDFWQRGISFVNPVSGMYLVDRFKIVNNVGNGSLPATVTHSKQVLATGELSKSTNYYRLTIDGAGNFLATDNYNIQQPIENGVRKICGTGVKVTLSFWARSSINGKKIAIGAQQYYGSGGSPSPTETLNGAYVTLTTSWQKYVITIDTNTIVGKTFGTNNDDLLKIIFVFAYGVSNSSLYNDTVAETFRGAGTIDIAQVKLESGDKATPFVPRLYGEELALCQRYFTTFNNLGNSWAVGAFLNGGGFKITLPIPSTLRYIPTRIVNTLGETQFYDDNGTWQTLSFANLYLIDGGIILNFNAPVANATTGKSYIVRYLPSLDSEIY